MSGGSYFLWDPLAAALAAGYPLGTFSAARVDVEEAEGPEVGFTRPVEGTSNVEYLSAADAAAAEDTLLETLNGASGAEVPVETATSASSPSPMVEIGPLEAGTYRIDDPELTTVPFTYTVPANWTARADGYVSKNADRPNEVVFTAIVTHVYTVMPASPRGPSQKSGTDGRRAWLAPSSIRLGQTHRRRGTPTSAACWPRASMSTSRRIWDLGGLPAWSGSHRSGPTRPKEAFFAIRPSRRAFRGRLHRRRGRQTSGHRVCGTPSTSATDVAELQAVLDSITFEP